MEHTIIESLSPSMLLQQEYMEMVPPLQEGSDITDTTDSITGEKTRRLKRLSSEKFTDEAEGSNNAKRLEHNAKERIRRVRLKEAYLDLSALLPDSTKSKKRSAATIVDRVLKYIPEMETKIEKLKQVRDNMQSASNKKQISIDQDRHSSQLQAPTVSVTQVKNGEAIIQICTRDDDDHGGFSNLLQKIEAQGISIRNASTLCICDDTVCYQLHVDVPYCSRPPTSAFILTLLKNNQAFLPS